MCVGTHLWVPALCSSCGAQHLGPAAYKVLGGHSPLSPRVLVRRLLAPEKSKN